MSESLIPGIAIGVVDSLDDPQGWGRLKVRLPWLDARTALWARAMVPLTGCDDLSVKVGDQVVVALESGDLDRPVVLGKLWSPG
jgi:uncharacterized protein involved in type VI secretion and phage assembly